MLGNGQDQLRTLISTKRATRVTQQAGLPSLGITVVLAVCFGAFESTEGNGGVESCPSEGKTAHSPFSVQGSLYV